MTAVVLTVADTSGPIPLVGNGATTSPSFTGGQNVVAGGLKMVVKTITTDNGTYTANGDSLTAAQLGLNSVVFAKIDGSGTGFAFQYDYTNSKLLAYKCAGSAAAFASAATTAAGTATLRVMAIGT